MKELKMAKRISAADRQASHEEAMRQRVKEIVDSAPPLSPAQADRLRALLAPGIEKVRQERLGQRGVRGDH